ncbi:MAG: TolB family protein, partial [Gemmatimonadales bacterium]
IFTQDGSKIVFHFANADDLIQGLPNFEIYIMNADGTNPVNLTNHPAADQEPAILGDQILFASNRAGAFQIFSMNLDGSNLQQLTTQGNNIMPDGFVAAGAGSGGLRSGLLEGQAHSLRYRPQRPIRDRSRIKHH